jgi:hypothetical protein
MEPPADSATSTVMHLYRGAPGVWLWSKYHETVTGWTLCGIRRNNPARPIQATEDGSQVSCTHCRDLMQAKSSDRDQKAMRHQMPLAARTSGQD